MDKNFRIRLGVAFLAIALLGAGVLVRAAFLMLTPSERLHTAMKRQFRQDPPRMPRRGYILDRNHEPIAVSMEVKSLFVNPGKVKDRRLVASLLAPPLGMKPAALRAKLDSDRAFVWLKRRLSDTEQRAVEEVLERHPAFSMFLGLTKESKRFYPNKGLASQLLGFTGLDSNGLEGVELFYEKELAGHSAPRSYADGNSLVVTIDKALQYTLEEELARGVRESGSISGTAIILDAEKGDIIAMASSPSFNGNSFGASTADKRRNRAVTDTYEPGSVMKPLVVAGALEAGVISPRTKVFGEFGRMKVGDHWIRESDSKHRWGWLTVGEVLQHSSNVGATKVGFLYGVERMYQWYRRLGFGERTGVDLPGEPNGSLARPERWSRILHSNLSFGQGLAATPLQVARAFAVIANGGIMVTPRVVRQLNTFEGEPLREFPVGARWKVLEKSTAEAVEKMLVPVATEDGSAPKAAIPGFTVIGKTGTSQKPIPGKGYRSGKYMSSFVGYVKGVSPNYVVLVMMDEPKFPYFGGEVAAPVFRRVMTAALAREGVAPNNSLPMPPIGKAEPEKQPEPAARAPATPVPAPPQALARADDNWLMPDLNGLTAREVLDLFSGKDLRLQVRGGGLVRAQQPPSGSLLKRGDNVAVRLEREVSAP